MIAGIVAISDNNVIGKNSTLPWYIPVDLKHFKDLTKNTVVIMGRKTADSLPLLAHRECWVLTSDKEYKAPNNKVKVFTSKEDILDETYKDPMMIYFIIGGAEIFKLFENDIHRWFITRVKTVVEGSNLTTLDLDLSNHNCVDTSEVMFNDEDGSTHSCVFEDWVRK